jgi:hypothetical protein
MGKMKGGHFKNQIFCGQAATHTKECYMTITWDTHWVACFLWKIHIFTVFHHLHATVSHHCQHYKASAWMVSTNAHMKPKMIIAEPTNHQCQIWTKCIFAGMWMKKNLSNKKKQDIWASWRHYWGPWDVCGTWWLVTTGCCASCIRFHHADPPICLIKRMNSSIVD